MPPPQSPSNSYGILPFTAPHLRFRRGSFHIVWQTPEFRSFTHRLMISFVCCGRYRLRRKQQPAKTFLFLALCLLFAIYLAQRWLVFILFIFFSRTRLHSLNNMWSNQGHPIVDNTRCCWPDSLSFSLYAGGATLSSVFLQFICRSHCFWLWTSYSSLIYKLYLFSLKARLSTFVSNYNSCLFFFYKLHDRWYCNFYLYACINTI